VHLVGHFHNYITMHGFMNVKFIEMCTSREANGDVIFFFHYVPFSKLPQTETEDDSLFED